MNIYTIYECGLFFHYVKENHKYLDSNPEFRIKKTDGIV